MFKKFNVTENMKLTYLAGTAKFLVTNLRQNPDMTVSELLSSVVKILKENNFDLSGLGMEDEEFERLLTN